MSSNDYSPLDRLDTLLASLININDISTYSSSNSLQTLCETLLNSCCKLLNSCHASVMIYDKNVKKLKILASTGAMSGLPEQIKMSPGVGIGGMVLESGEIIVVENPKDNPYYINHLGITGQTLPLICVPIKTKNEVLGVINIHSQDFRIISDNYTKNMLLVLAGKAAMTIESMSLFDTLTSRNFEMVETLSRALDAKDHYTHDHAGRAKIKAERISHILNFSEKEVVQVQYAALLHDIGKLGVPENILLKPGRLTEQEFDEVKKHPEIGYKILLPVSFLSDVAKMVLYHQEWSCAVAMIKNSEYFIHI